MSIAQEIKDRVKVKLTAGYSFTTGQGRLGLGTNEVNVTITDTDTTNIPVRLDVEKGWYSVSDLEEMSVFFKKLAKKLRERA